MTDPERDDVFEAYLQRRPVLPALDEKVEPPAALDRLVLTQAREAVQPASSAPMQRPPRWAVPTALAATVLLCLSVAINISLNTHRPSLNRDSMSGEIASKEVVLPEAKVVGAPAPRAPVVAEAAAEPAAPPVMASAEVKARQFKRSLADAAPGGAQPAAPPAFAANNGPNRAQPPGFAPSDSAGARDKLAPAAAEDKAAALAKSAGAVAPEYTPAPEAARMASRVAAKAAAVAPHPSDPKVWLQQIAALRAAGKTEQANAEMQRFEAAFPNYAPPK